MNTSSLTHDAGHTAGQALPELIEALKKATGPDRELDVQINAFICEHVLGWEWWKIGGDAEGKNDSVVLRPRNLAAGFTYPPKGRVGEHYHVPRTELTSSVDAAMALVPPHSEYEMGSAKLLNTYWAIVIDTKEHKAKGCPNQAIALCIAALEARSQP